MVYCSQLGQDRFIDNFFNKKQFGVFLDIGAHDGVTISNTYFLERERNWTGICIEPQEIEFKKLTENRKSINLNLGVLNYIGEADFTLIDGYANMLSGISNDYNDTHKNRINGEVNHYGGEIKHIKIPVKPLQNILDEYELYDIDF